jgi:hypothetical protein
MGTAVESPTSSAANGLATDELPTDGTGKLNVSR